MAMTYSTFVSNLAGLTVTGVTRAYTYPPRAVETADLPAMFPRIPSGTEGPMTVKDHGGNPEITCELVILYEAVEQNTQPTNFTNTLTQLDNLNTALRGAPVGKNTGAIGTGPLTWTIQHTQVERGDRDYWAVVATVTGFGL